MPRIGLLKQQLAEVARIGAQSRYRKRATQAYAEICLDRLESLDVRRVPGLPSLDDFTERRLLPAMRTCATFSRRLDDLAERAARADAPLQTRIDTQLARQNGTYWRR